MLAAEKLSDKNLLNLPSKPNPDSSTLSVNVPKETSLKDLIEVNKQLLDWIHFDAIKQWFEERRGVESEIQGLRMAKEFFVHQLKYATQSESMKYFRGKVKSTHSKSAMYYPTIVLDVQKRIIVSTSCTCRVGAGNHAVCKHVSATVYVIYFYVKEHKLMVQSCTSILQKWHKPNIGPNFENRTIKEMYPLKPIDSKLMQNVDTEKANSNLVNCLQNLSDKKLYIPCVNFY